MGTPLPPPPLLTTTTGAAAANTVPVNWPRLGELVLVSTATRHPVALSYVADGLTGSQLPPFSQYNRWPLVTALQKSTVSVAAAEEVPVAFARLTSA